ncbi:PucR family transcriptional regulator [Streptomyces sp. GC420]|nr:PucR family transcriptional regulator [Streptomyces sp. GC420]
MRRQAARPDTRRFLDWLHGRTGAQFALLGPDGTVTTATRHFPHGVLGGLDTVTRRLAAGEMESAAVESGRQRIRCDALGPAAPRSVLVTATDTTTNAADAATGTTATAAGAPAPATGNAQLLAAHTPGLLSLLLGAQQTRTVTRAYHEKAWQVRLAIMSALMVGDPVLARRMTGGEPPALLDAESLRVYLLRCAPDDRDGIAEKFQDAAGYHGDALLVRCPVFDEHLICLLAEDGAQELRAALRRLVREQSRYILGVSDPQPLRETGAAYGQAVHALAVARHLPGREADYRGHAGLEKALPREEAVAWARAFLHPLHQVPRATVDIVRLSVTFPRSAVARLLGISRNTVTAHVKRAARALDLDLDRVRARSAVDLALSLAAPPSSPSGLDDGHRRPAAVLDQLLRTPQAVAWAQALLRPVRVSDRPLLTTVRGWIDADTDAQAAAQRLGISRNTVRSHLREAERLLNRDLLAVGSGVHDVVHALHITREPGPETVPGQGAGAETDI